VALQNLHPRFKSGRRLQSKIPAGKSLILFGSANPAGPETRFGPRFFKEVRRTSIPRVDVSPRRPVKAFTTFGHYRRSGREPTSSAERAKIALKSMMPALP